MKGMSSQPRPRLDSQTAQDSSDAAQAGERCRNVARKWLIKIACRKLKSGGSAKHCTQGVASWEKRWKLLILRGKLNSPPPSRWQGDCSLNLGGVRARAAPLCLFGLLGARGGLTRQVPPRLFR